VDETMKELETRFPVNDMEKIAALEQLVVNAALGKPYEMHEKAALEYPGSADWNSQQQFDCFHNLGECLDLDNVAGKELDQFVEILLPRN